MTGTRTFPSIHETAIIDIRGKAIIPKTTHIEAGAIIQVGKDAELILGEKVTIYPGVIIRAELGRIEIGSNVSLGPGVRIYEPRGGLYIGNNSLIAGGVSMCGVSHGFKDTGLPIRQQPQRIERIEIGEDTWIGMNAVINPGIRVGSHSVIGSGSVVTRSIEDWGIAYGVPCRRVNDRREIER